MSGGSEGSHKWQLLTPTPILMPGPSSFFTCFQKMRSHTTGSTLGYLRVRSPAARHCKSATKTAKLATLSPQTLFAMVADPPVDLLDWNCREESCSWLHHKECRSAELHEAWIQRTPNSLPLASRETVAHSNSYSTRAMVVSSG
ncbi:hypothetical protein K2D_19830 [Planctomycetes bacterium K2D]|nr:hypothetical protein K2D_19830 [Planctomycetes bacterium K2D]